MTLRVSAELVGSDILDAPFVDVARRDVPGADEVSQPLRRERIDLVVVGAHDRTPRESASLRRVGNFSDMDFPLTDLKMCR
jgi:hypothetical protein